MTKDAETQHDDKPLRYKAVRVWLGDGTRMVAMWTGTKWWSTKGEISPVKWELEVKKKKTEKLLDKLPKSERPPKKHSPENN